MKQLPLFSTHSSPEHPVTTRRLIVLDQNICGIGGHFAELTSVILEGGVRLGFEPWLVSHENLRLHEVRGGNSTNPTARVWEEMSEHGRILPAFTVAKMHRWSLANNGHSRFSRNSVGSPRIAGLKSYWQLVIDQLHKESPRRMMKEYSKTITGVFDQLSLTSDDIILFATCDDFIALTAASAIQRLDASTSLNLHFLFHTQLIDQRAGQWRYRGYCNREFILQMEEAQRLLKGHRSCFWATTKELADQLNLMTDRYCAERKLVVTTHWRSIDYPIRQEFSPSIKQPNSPKRLIMGGKVRSEKGAKEIRSLVDSVWESQLAKGRWQLCFQGSQRDAKRLLPRRAYNHLGLSVGRADRTSPISFMDGKLSADDYASLICSADAGLFLYDSRRYYARCSGVLVEMLSAGIPVIVPSGCWLSRQLAGEVSRWLANRQVGEVLFEDDNSQILRWKADWREFLFNPGDAQAIIVELYLDSPQSDDYVGIQLEQAHVSRSPQTNHCEVFEQGPVRSCFRVAQSFARCRLRIGLPYQQRDLHLQRLVIRKASDLTTTGNVTSTIGLMAASTQEIPRLLEELGDSYEHYRLTAIEHAQAWREAHSGYRFVQRMLSESSNG